MGQAGQELEELEEIVETVSEFQKYLDLYLPKIINFGIRLLLALLAFAIGVKVIRLIRKFIHRSMERAGAETGVIQFLDSLVKALLYFVLVMLLASGFGVDTTSVMALVGSAGLAVGLALQGSLSNFAGGVLILTLKPFRVGDYIIQGDLEGTVSEIQMFYTILLTADNQKIVIPNGNLANNSLTNMSDQDKRRLDTDVRISYEEDFLRVKKICTELLEKEERVLKEEDHAVLVADLGESAMLVRLRCWVRASDYWSMKWDMMENVKLKFDEEGISISVPRMDVRMKE